MRFNNYCGKDGPIVKTSLVLAASLSGHTDTNDFDCELHGNFRWLSKLTVFVYVYFGNTDFSKIIPTHTGTNSRITRKETQKATKRVDNCFR